MRQYLDLLEDVMTNGVEKSDRTGVGTRSVFGRQLRFNLEDGFPLVTTRKLHFKSIVEELIWLLSGSTNNNDLEKQGVTIWREWAKEDGSLGRIYGHQWRSWQDYSGGSIDQISDVIRQIKTNPDSRRMIVSAWNVADLPEMSLPPCHLLFQFYVANGKLSCQLYQRSADATLGVSYNIASYALLTHMMAQVCDLSVGDFIHCFGDLHIYKTHYKGVEDQLKRDPLLLPTIKLNPKIKDIFAFRYEDIELKDYVSHPKIHFPVAV